MDISTLDQSTVRPLRCPQVSRLGVFESLVDRHHSPHGAIRAIRTAFERELRIVAWPCGILPALRGQQHKQVGVALLHAQLLEIDRRVRFVGGQGRKVERDRESQIAVVLGRAGRSVRVRGLGGLDLKWCGLG